MSPPCKGGAKPTQLNPLKWSLQSDSNQRPADYKSAALPTELWRQFVGICSSHIHGFPHTRGAVDRVRTCDLVLGRNELYQLSYYRLKWSVVADITPEVTTHIILFAVPTGFEPVPRTVTGWNCNHSTTGPINRFFVPFVHHNQFLHRRLHFRNVAAKPYL